MPGKTLATFHDNFTEDSTLKSVVISRLYQKKFVSELDELVRVADCDTSIDKMTLTSKNELVMFPKEEPYFVSRIFCADNKTGNNESWNGAYQSIHEEIQMKSSPMKLGLVDYFDPSLLPHSLTLITVQFTYDHQLERIGGWPSSLTKLKICNHKEASLIELPNTLKELSCHGVAGVWHDFPPKLRKLTFESSDWIPLDSTKFPESLRELLALYCCLPDIEKLVDKLPGKLRVLKLGDDIGGKLSSLSFPIRLKLLILRNVT